jgi:hypothetical protein
VSAPRASAGWRCPGVESPQNPGDGFVPVLEVLHRLAVGEWRHAGKAIPQLSQAAGGPLGGGLDQFLLAPDHDGSGQEFGGFLSLSVGFVRSDVVIDVDCEDHRLAPLP